MTPRAHTFSVVARDPASGELGVAVQSHWFSVGPLCPWAQAGVGAVATQSLVEVSYGPLGLERMRDGMTAPQALASLLAADGGREVRQVAMVDAQGRAAAHTGTSCIACASHEVGDGWSVQANMMLSDAVVPAMAKAMRGPDCDLAERLLRALEAAQEAGGDIRGMQSAAMIVVKGERAAQPWEGRVLELRVEDHRNPLRELRRLLGLQRAYIHMNEGDRAVEHQDFAAALREYGHAAALSRANPEIEFWSALALARAGERKPALARLRRIARKNPNWKELLARLPQSGLLDESLVRELLAEL